MDISLLEELQSKFKCTQCGKCCAVGGDMGLSPADVSRMSACLCVSFDYFWATYLDRYCGSDGELYIKSTHPCCFLDKFSKECLVHESKPRACRDYPFKLYARGECNLDAVLTCPVAVKMLEDHLKGVE